MQAFHRLAAPALVAVVLIPAAMLTSLPHLEGSRAGAPPAAAAMPPEPAPIGVTASSDTAVFAGGCFWGIEAVFEHLQGVSSATSGYAGGSAPSPAYD
jgi:peptide-methionine (S)-S-oxide reductase